MALKQYILAWWASFVLMYSSHTNFLEQSVSLVGIQLHTVRGAHEWQRLQSQM